MTKAITKRSNQKANPDEGGWHWTNTAALFGMFGGAGSLIYLGQKTIADWWVFPAIWLAATALACLIPLSVYRKKFPMSRLEWGLFNFLGVGGILSAGLLWFNFLVPGEIETSKHTIVDKKIEAGNQVTFIFDDGFLRKHERNRTFDVSPEPEIYNTFVAATAVEFQIGKGGLGLPVILERELIP